MFDPQRDPVVLATANAHKAEEIGAILQGWHLLPRPIDVGDVDETDPTLVGNARLKARALVDATGVPALADDTGLEVDALDGAPGVRSARYAGEHATDAQNVDKLLAELQACGATSLTARTARFRTIALLMFPDGREVVGDGTIEGVIVFEPRGENGFGYDVVFVPTESASVSVAEQLPTFAQMSAAEKNGNSHRSRAFLDLARQVNAE